MSLPLVKLMAYAVPTTEMRCFKKSANFEIVTQKQDNHLMSTKLLTSQVDAFEEKALGPRTEIRAGTGRRAGTQEEAVACTEAHHWPQRETSHLSRSHLNCKTRQILHVLHMSSPGSCRHETHGFQHSQRFRTFGHL